MWAIILFILNLLDGIITRYEIINNIAQEFNPIYYGQFGIVELIIKMIITSIACIILYITRGMIVSKICTKVIVLIYFILLIYHIVGIIYL